MNAFRTTFDIAPLKKQINYKSQLLSFGSCFSENIGEKLKLYKFNTIINPFGILYNPESVANSIEILIKKKLFKEADLFHHKGIWNSFYHHSRFSDTDLEACLSNINQSIEEASNKIFSADYLLITFGTAWVYELKRNGRIVSNCHKIPASEFTRYRMASCDIVERFSSLIKKIKTENIGCQIIFTVSPVRHLKDGVVENQLSKATLIMAVNELVESFDKVHYFPSYELMMDDLRDYRFYADDMIHPSAKGVDYIWSKFTDACIDKNAYKTMKQVEKILQAVNHRPFQPNTQAHRTFLRKTIDKINSIHAEYPELNFEQEVQQINQQLEQIKI